jgi:cysteine-rich repeat protein
VDFEVPVDAGFGGATMNRIVSCVAFALAWTVTFATAASAQSFGLDDNPSAPLIGFSGFGLGAEDPYAVGTYAVGIAPPSPSLGILFPPLGDGSILAPGPAVQHPGPDGFYVDSLSTLKTDLGRPIRLLFSVDRVSIGSGSAAVSNEAVYNQQAGDIYVSYRAFAAPGSFVGTLGAGPFSGTLAAELGGPLFGNSNILVIDESALGLLAGGMIVPPGTMAPSMGVGTHDNIDQFDLALVDANPADGLFDVPAYFTVYPDEAVASGLSPSDIIDVPAGAPGGLITAPPFAAAVTMGLDSGGLGTDSIDALIMFDNNVVGGPAYGGPGGEPGIDYALFSLAPGSLSLATFSLSAADIFFTDFSGAFAEYAAAGRLALFGLSGGLQIAGDSVDALDFVTCGDGNVDFGEECDDGNNVDGDCCSSLCLYESSGSACTGDGSVCTVEECDGTGTCLHLAQPILGCFPSFKSDLLIKDKADDAKDLLRWRWKRGQTTFQADYDDPSSTATYTVCVYDETGGVASLATQLIVPPGAAWTDKSPKGWRYKDKAGTYDGVQRIKLKPSGTVRSKVELKAKGVNLPMPVPFSGTEFFDLDTDVTVQLFNSDTLACWSSTFTSAKKNTVDRFQAKGFVPSP